MGRTSRPFPMDSDFTKLKALIFNKKLREKHNIDSRKLSILIRKYFAQRGESEQAPDPYELLTKDTNDHLPSLFDK